jgi:RNA polymerase sigma factor (sigma-70 family)
MADIRDLVDYPLLDEVDFCTDVEDNEDNEYEDYEFKCDCVNKSPNELGLIFAMSHNEIDFERLYNVIKKRLYKNISKIVGTNKDDIETVIDSTMLDVYFNIDKFDNNKSSFYTWVYIIARCKALKYIKKARNNNIYSTDFSDLYDSSVMVDDADDSTNNCLPSYVTEDEGFVDIVYDNGVYKVYQFDDVIDDFFGVIYRCINDMSPLKKETFVSRFINNRTVKETADDIGVSNTTIKRYYSEGKKGIVCCIKNDHPELYEMMKEIY